MGYRQIGNNQSPPFLDRGCRRGNWSHQRRCQERGEGYVRLDPQLRLQRLPSQAGNFEGYRGLRFRTSV